MKIQVAVIGVTGYSGLELTKLILKHPHLECTHVMASEQRKEAPLEQVHSQLLGLTALKCKPMSPERVEQLHVDTVFLCTPHEVSLALVPSLLGKGMRVVDLSGAFRLKDPSSYPRWYGFEHKKEALLRSAVYGLPEWNRESIVAARLLANPGCYPTSLLLPAKPLMHGGMLDPECDIVCDSKSGVTGAGRSTSASLMFGEVSENFRSYSPITHRHLPEMCQELGWKEKKFLFVPHLLPVNRGIFSTIYVRFNRSIGGQELEQLFSACYHDEPFVRLLGANGLPELRAVVGTNFCDIGWTLLPDGRTAVFYSVLDNLMKGAAGQAIQNVNIMNGWAPDIGLAGRQQVATYD